jgi:nucleotide-binding universal stress UspA family protein
MFDVLAPVRHVHNWEGSPRYAAGLVATLGGTLTGLYAHEPLSALPAGGSTALLAEAVEFLRELLDTALHAGPDFQRWAGAAGATCAQWRVGQGSLRQMLAAAAPWHDVVVIGADADGVWESPSGLAELLLGLRQPCIVVPPGIEHARLDAVAVAWNGAPEGTRALRSALPLLRHASRRVLLRASVPQAAPLELEDPSHYLARHGIEHELRVIDAGNGRIGTVLLQEAERFGADLLAMGAYGRSRFSEWVLGGATREVLVEARLPVLLQH